MKNSSTDFIFINCPFDEEYFQLLQPMLFTIIYLRKAPLISETMDSGESRLLQIIKLMQASAYSIHDLSRIKSDIPRFNMPLELGIDLGLRYSNQKVFNNKKILILESEKYSLKPIISDLGGNDTKHHNNTPKQIVKCVRDWFYSAIEKTNTTYIDIFNDYEIFIDNLEEGLKNKKITIPRTIDTMPMSELTDNMKLWIQQNAITSIAR